MLRLEPSTDVLRLHAGNPVVANSAAHVGALGEVAAHRAQGGRVLAVNHLSISSAIGEHSTTSRRPSNPFAVNRNTLPGLPTHSAPPIATSAEGSGRQNGLRVMV